MNTFLSDKFANELDAITDTQKREVLQNKLVEADAQHDMRTRNPFIDSIIQDLKTIEEKVNSVYFLAFYG